MSTRHSRSASIPIPRTGSTTSSARNLENLISIPGPSTTRPRFPSGPSRSPDERRASAFYPTSLPGPSTRPVSRSYTQGSGAHSNASTSASRRIEPRIIRPDSAGWKNPSATSPTRARKSSGVGIRPQSSATMVPSNSSHLGSISSSQATFPRPSYLDHSALRAMLQTDAPSTLGAGSIDNLGLESTSYGHRATTPSTDSDDSTAGLPHQEHQTPRHSQIPPPDAQALRLPTRWSDKIRHTSLTISSNGRDLIFQGKCHTFTTLLFS